MMTRTEFYEALVAEGLTFTLHDTDAREPRWQPLRDDARRCPLEALAAARGLAYAMHDGCSPAYAAGEALGLAPEDIKAIGLAADSTWQPDRDRIPGDGPRIRRALLGLDGMDAWRKEMDRR